MVKLPFLRELNPKCANLQKAIIFYRQKVSLQTKFAVTEITKTTSLGKVIGLHVFAKRIEPSPSTVEVPFVGLEHWLNPFHQILSITKITHSPLAAAIRPRLIIFSNEVSIGADVSNRFEDKGPLSKKENTLPFFSFSRLKWVEK